MYVWACECAVLNGVRARSVSRPSAFRPDEVPAAKAHDSTDTIDSDGRDGARINRSARYAHFGFWLSLICEGVSRACLQTITEQILKPNSVSAKPNSAKPLHQSQILALLTGPAMPRTGWPCPFFATGGVRFLPSSWISGVRRIAGPWIIHVRTCP